MRHRILKNPKKFTGEKNIKGIYTWGMREGVEGEEGNRLTINLRERDMRRGNVVMRPAWEGWSSIF